MGVGEKIVVETGVAVGWRWDVMVNQDHQGLGAGAMPCDTLLRCYAMHSRPGKKRSRQRGTAELSDHHT